MTLCAKLSLLALIAGGLASCGHHDLKAPCSASEGVLPLGYADAPPLDACGPLRQINSPFDVMPLSPPAFKAMP